MLLLFSIKNRFDANYEYDMFIRDYGEVFCGIILAGSRVK